MLGYTTALEYVQQASAGRHNRKCEPEGRGAIHLRDYLDNNGLAWLRQAQVASVEILPTR